MLNKKRSCSSSLHKHSTYVVDFLFNFFLLRKFSLFPASLRPRPFSGRRVPGSPAKNPHRGFAACYRLPCEKPAPRVCRVFLGSPVQGELAKPQVLTEGLYPLTGYSVYTFHSLLCSFVTKRKAVFFSSPSPTGSLTAYFQYNYFARLS